MTPRKPRQTALDQQTVSFGRWLRYENRSRKTVEIYTSAVTRLAAWLEREGIVDWKDVRRDHIQGFIVDILDNHSAGYARNFVRGTATDGEVVFR
jgi:site-specific recombinase XerD